jgi:hypothetical protein
MAPILGILASGISGNLWKPGADYDSIATITPYTTTTTVNFTSIPQTYRHLQVRLIAVSSTVNSGRLTFNNDSTNGNYASHELYGNGTTAFGDSYVGTLTGILMPGYAGMGGSTTIPTASIIDILDYTSTNKTKVVRGLSGLDVNGAGGYVELGSGLWNSTAAITSLKITIAGGTIAANSHFALYGIR